MDVFDLRRSKEDHALSREDLAPDPFVQFELWFGEACEHVPFEPNGMSLSTVDGNGRPTTRTVLLKTFDERGFVFFTNYSSAKATDIEANSQVCLHFFWRELGRQLKINGEAAKIPTAETLKYFATRPRGSQIGAWVSEQSSVVSSRSLLEMQFQKMKDKFANKEVPLPSFWGGYRVVPDVIEFWQGRTNRLHDRFQYSRQDDDGWVIERLAP
ncbi:MAG: pyridoxamine 5'-phosphate oxidase [Pseudomonadota bacterium]